MLGPKIWSMLGPMAHIWAPNRPFWALAQKSKKISKNHQDYALDVDDIIIETLLSFAMDLCWPAMLIMQPAALRSSGFAVYQVGCS